MNNRWIMAVPVVSTAHIKPETAKFLEFEETAGIQSYDLGDCGLLIFCGVLADTLPDNLEDYPDITEVMRWARANGSNGWVRLDAAGDVIDELPQYEWS